MVRNSTVGPGVSIGTGSTVEGTTLVRTVVQNHSTVRGMNLKNSMIGSHAQLNGGFSSVSLGDYSQLEA